jgi:hypothetical protein
VNERDLDLEHVEVDVEPLGDPRWTRIERGMFAKLERTEPAPKHGRRMTAVLWGGGVCAIAAAALAIVVGSPGAARPGDPLRPVTTRLVTTDSPSRFTIGESSLLLAPSSLVLVSGDDERGIDVVLDRGTVTCEVAPRRGRPPFIVDAGEVRVEVVGTRFTVARGPTETSVGVDHGVVDVAVGGIVTVLHDGERWPAAAASPAETEPAPAPAASGIAPDAPSAAVRTPARPRPASSSSGVSSAAMDDVPGARAASGASAAISPTASSPAPPSAQESFESAARIERTRPDEAAAIYRKLASGGSGWAGSALFALARLESDRGHRSDAARLLGQYLALYPGGINADDARALLERER